MRRPSEKRARSDPPPDGRRVFELRVREGLRQAATVRLWLFPMLFPPTQTTSLLSPSSSYTMNYPFLSTPNFALPTISQLPPTPQSRNSPVPQVPNRPTGRPPRLPSINSLHLPGLLRQQPHPPTSPPRDQESRATSPTQARNKPVSRRTPSGHRIAARRTFSLKESYPVKEPPAPPAEKDQKVSSAHKQLPPTVGLSVFFWGGGLS